MICCGSYRNATHFTDRPPMTAPRKPARTGAAPQGWQAAFLVSLRQTGNVSAAARAAGTCRSRCY